MAEYILRHLIKSNKVKWWDVCSRGIYVNSGDKINYNSQLVLKEIGIEVNSFNSKQLTQKIIEKSVAVFCMTNEQKKLLEGCGNIHSISDVIGFDILDPYGGSLVDYREVCKQLILACQEIFNKFIVGEDK